MEVVIIITWIALTILCYLTVRHYINKKSGLNLPLFPDRYYDNPSLTLVMAILAIGSVVVGLFLTKLVFGLL